MTANSPPHAISKLTDSESESANVAKRPASETGATKRVLKRPTSHQEFVSSASQNDGTQVNETVDENKEDTQPVFKRPASKVPKRKAIRCKSKDVSWFDQDLMLTLSRSMSHYQRQIPKDWGRRFRACEFGSGSGRLSRALVDEGIATLAFDIKVGGIHHDITR